MGGPDPTCKAASDPTLDPFPHAMGAASVLGVWGLLAFQECPDPQILGPKPSFMKGLGEKRWGREQCPQ